MTARAQGLMTILDRIATIHGEMTGWRRHLHQNPELGFEEHETAAFVADKLKSFGVDEVHTGIAGTGIVGVLRAGAGGRSVGLRADLDALPIREETGLPWASQAAGKMHACGHDGHTAMLLGAARYLAETRDFDGTVYLIFQPAEEVGGGERMVAAGLFERFPAERVFGLHNRPQLPVGRFAMRTGPAYAGCDDFTIRLEGRGCHAGWPHLGRDPIVAGAQLVLALQTLVARQVDPLDQAVVSVTRHAGGDAHNVIPGAVDLWGTVRTYRLETRDFLRRRLTEVMEGIAAAAGVGASLIYVSSLPPVVNGRGEAAFGADVAAEVVGEAGVDRDPPPVRAQLVRAAPPAARDPRADQEQARGAWRRQPALPVQHRASGLARPSGAHARPGRQLGETGDPQQPGRVRRDPAMHSHVFRRAPAGALPHSAGCHCRMLVGRRREQLGANGRNFVGEPE